MSQDVTRGEVPHRIRMLESLGVRVHHDYVYEGEVGPERHRIDLLDTVTSVLIPLTPLEWCLTSMYEPPPHPDPGREYQSFYVGPCCGITGALQDVWTGIFRTGGWADAADLLRVGELARQHEGFDEFLAQDDAEFEKLVRVWQGHGFYDPWAKVGIVFNAVEPYLKPRRWENPSEDRSDRDEEKRLIRRLDGAVSALHWNDLFSRSDSEEVNDAHEAYRALMRAKVAPLASRLAEKIGEVTFEGFAIAEPGATEPMANSYGPCIYLTREAGERVLELWDRNGGRGDARLVPARVDDGNLVLEGS